MKTTLNTADTCILTNNDYTVKLKTVLEEATPNIRIISETKDPPKLNQGYTREGTQKR